MCLEYLDRLLEPIAQPFDERIEEIGRQLEAGLTKAQASVLDDLDAAHWDRSGALVNKTFHLAVELGIVIGQHLAQAGVPPATPPEGP